MPEIKLRKKLIYAGDAYRAILDADPKLAYCIERIKGVDAVDVVRCKDCVHMKNQFNARFCNVWCMYNGMGDEGFCNYGERKGNENSRNPSV